METIAARLTVFFDEPFWVGVYERTTGNKLEVCKITFGAEPKDYEVYGFLLLHWKDLRFSPQVAGQRGVEKKINPKRMQRAISNQLATHGISTKAQQALKLQQEQSKLERKTMRHQKTEEEKELKFALKQQKKKEKHKGR